MQKTWSHQTPINLSFKYTGGGLTGCADAVSFELLKNAIIHYYQHIIQNGDIKVKIDNDTDKKGLVVSMIIRVSVNNISAYAISIYYTKCSFLVNGKNVNKFIEEDLPNITSVAINVILNGSSQSTSSKHPAWRTITFTMKKSRISNTSYSAVRFWIRQDFETIADLIILQNCYTMNHSPHCQTSKSSIYY